MQQLHRGESRLRTFAAVAGLAGLGMLLGRVTHGVEPPETFPGPVVDWQGFARHDFEIDGKPVLVVKPGTPAAGRPWVWHGEFFGHKPDPDVALLGRGFHIVYTRIPDQFGSPAAVEHWNRCYEQLTGRYGLARKAALVGLSRGGLYCYNWAIANPDRVACLYGDAPVCDFKSWPGGRGIGKRSERDWKLVLEQYGFRSEREALAYPGNPVDRLAPLAEAGVPLLHVFGDADDVVPWEENTKVVADRYQKLGGAITLIRKPGVKHHPHGLEDSTPIVEFIERHALPPSPEHPDLRTYPVERTAEGFLRHRVVSPYQRDETEVLVLLPDRIDAGRRCPVLFVLPVEAGQAEKWGHGLREVQKHDLHNKYGLICVMPTFSDVPWYADHPSDQRLKQESHLLRVVLPLLRWEYPQARHDRDGRLLLGFSKSGWGAWSLLLRNPHLFHRAAAWDAPFNLSAPGKYESGPIFGNAANFEAYRPSRLAYRQRADFQESPRLIHLGYGNFRGDHENLELVLNSGRIARVYRDGPQRPHHWESGWVPEAVRLLVDPAAPAESP